MPDAAEQTKAQKAAADARDKFQKAKDANAKNDNPATKKALADAREVMRVAVKAENRERFTGVGVDRTKKARAAIRRLVNVANPKTYEYTAEEGQKIVAGLKEAVKDVENAFSNAGNSAATGDTFTL